MTKKEQESVEDVVFNSPAIGRAWIKRFNESVTRGTRAQLILQRPIPDSGSAEERKQQFDEKIDANDLLSKLGDEQAVLVAEVLVSVPRSWLIPGAPDEIDWSDPANLDYIQMQHYADILERLRNGNVLQVQAKN